MAFKILNDTKTNTVMMYQYYPLLFKTFLSCYLSSTILPKPCFTNVVFHSRDLSNSGRV